MAHPRLITRGAMKGITRRTTLRKAFLAPWHPLVGETWAYLLASAQTKTGIELHHSTLVANHHHTGATANDYQLDKATWYLHRDASCVLNSLLEAEGYDSPGEVFDGRRPSWTTCVDPAAEEKRIIYDSLNAVAAGFVESPEDMPFGHHFGFEQWLEGPLTVKRPDVPYLHKRPKTLTLTLTPPAKLYRAWGGNMPALVEHLREQQDARVAEEAVLRGARPVRGVDRMRAMHPWDEPRTKREPRGARTPSFSAAPGEEGRSVRVQCALETSHQRDHNRERVEAWKNGDKTSPAPTGALRWHTFHGLDVEPAGPDAILGAVYPSFAEVKAELDAERKARNIAQRERDSRSAARRRARAEADARDAALREAEDAAARFRVLDEPDVELRPAPAQKREPRGGGGRVTETRHVYDTTPPSPDAARLIILRDRRRRKRSHGDPPE